MAFFGGIPGMLKGAGVGAGLGYLGADGDYLRAMGGGAIGGALMGGFGAVGMRKLAGGRTIAGMAQTGLGYGIRGLGITGGALAGGGRFSRGMANIAGLGIGGMFNARNWLGRNAAITNKVGGITLGAIGVASAAHMGSSVLSSNRGF